MIAPTSVAQPTSPLCLGLMPQLLGGGVINQTSPDVVLMLLSPVAHCQASWKRSRIITHRTRLPTAPAPTCGLIRLLSSFNIPVSHKKCLRGGEGIVQTRTSFASARLDIQAAWAAAPHRAAPRALLMRSGWEGRQMQTIKTT